MTLLRFLEIISFDLEFCCVVLLHNKYIYHQIHLVVLCWVDPFNFCFFGFPFLPSFVWLPVSDSNTQGKNMCKLFKQFGQFGSTFIEKWCSVFAQKIYALYTVHTWYWRKCSPLIGLNFRFLDFSRKNWQKLT